MTVTENISAPTSYDRDRDLVAAAQTAETALVADPAVGEYVRRFPTPESEAALLALLTAYRPLLRRVARSSRVLDTEEAEAVATEALIRAAYDFDLSRPTAFAGFANSRVIYAVRDAESTSHAVSVPADQVGLALRLIRDLGTVEAAYHYCAQNPAAAKFSPVTFLAAVHAMSAGTIAPVGASLPVTTPGPEERAVADALVAYLFTVVTEAEARVLRLAYGFTDLVTENIRVTAGFDDSPMSDQNIAHALHTSRPRVQRTRATALAKMRAAVQSLIDEETTR